MCSMSQVMETAMSQVLTELTSFTMVVPRRDQMPTIAESSGLVVDNNINPIISHGYKITSLGQDTTSITQKQN